MNSGTAPANETSNEKKDRPSCSDSRPLPHDIFYQNFKQGHVVFHLILADHANSLKAGRKAAGAMPESSIQATKSLCHVVEVLMAFEGSRLELLYIPCVVWVVGAYLTMVASVALVANGLLANRLKLLPQTVILEDGNIVHSGLERPIHPHKTRRCNGYSKLIVDAGLGKLVRVILPVLRPVWVLWLVDPTVSAIHRDDPNVIAPVIRPCDLLCLECLNLLQVEPNPLPSCLGRDVPRPLPVFFGGILLQVIHCHEEVLWIELLFRHLGSFHLRHLQILPYQHTDQGICTKLLSEALDVGRSTCSMDSPFIVEDAEANHHEIVRRNDVFQLRQEGVALVIIVERHGIDSFGRSNLAASMTLPKWRDIGQVIEEIHETPYFGKEQKQRDHGIS